MFKFSIEEEQMYSKNASNEFKISAQKLDVMHPDTWNQVKLPSFKPYISLPCTVVSHSNSLDSKNAFFTLRLWLS